MKKILISGLLLAFILTVLSPVSAAFGPDAEPNPTGAYLKCVAVVDKPDTTEKTLAHCSYLMIKTDYVIQEGDMLEYDVKFDFDEYGGFGALDGDISGFGAPMRDAPGMSDQNGVGVHIGVYMREYAFDQWYHRCINIGTTEDEAEKFSVGKKLTNVQFGVHPSSAEPFDFTVTVLYANIVITNNGEVKYSIFQKVEDFIPEDVRRIGSEFVTAEITALVFTQEELDAAEAAKQAKLAEEASREASRAEAEASREASREEANREAESIKASEEEAAAAAAASEAETEDAKTESEGGNLILIIAIAGGGALLVVIVVIIAVGGKKKKGETK
jgi:hypothetical protein